MINLSIAIDNDTPSLRSRVGYHVHTETAATIAGLLPGLDFAWPLLTAMIPAMRSIPIEYDERRNANLRKDGRTVYDVSVFRVKKPAATGVERRDQPSVTR